MIENKYNFNSQSIGLDSIVNARQLGGIVLPNGKKVKNNLLLRGGNLNQASDKDIDRLENEFHVIHVFDFRTKMEIRHAPDIPLMGSSYTWLPTIDEKTERPGENTLPRQAFRDLENYILIHAFDKDVQIVARQLYPMFIRNEFSQLQYAVFLQKLCEMQQGAVYWHCSQGKDRTGLAAAFLLAALGADRQTILMDYDISNDYYRDLVDGISSQIIAKGGGEEELKVVKTFLGANVDYFDEALDIIDNEYGGIDKYLSQVLCLSSEDIKTLQDKFLEQ